jgi:hypothetical protein
MIRFVSTEQSSLSTLNFRYATASQFGEVDDQVGSIHST